MLRLQAKAQDRQCFFQERAVMVHEPPGNRVRREGALERKLGPIHQGLWRKCCQQRGTAYLSSMRSRPPARLPQPTRVQSPPLLSHEDSHMCLRFNPWLLYNFANQLGSFLVSGHKSADAQLSFTSTNILHKICSKKQLYEQIILTSSNRFFKSSSKMANND